jgi:hypothetical protein
MDKNQNEKEKLDITANFKLFEMLAFYASQTQNKEDFLSSNHH